MTIQEKLDEYSRQLGCIQSGKHLAKSIYHKDKDHFWIEEIPCVLCSSSSFDKWKKLQNV